MGLTINIEKFFLLTLLRISIVGVAFILVTDFFFYPQDVISLYIDFVILSACVFSYIIRNKYFIASTLVITVTTLVAMFYQCMVVPLNTTTSLSIILLVGFTFSILLKDMFQWVMHGITVVMIITIFILLATISTVHGKGEIVTLAVTYLILYFIISYSTGVLKVSYDNVNRYLNNANNNLKEKANEIESQNEELLQIQNNLNALNKDLERMVDERTDKIKAQNEMLIKYSYTNAHHLRGPIARLLGLVAIWRMDQNPDYSFYFDTMEKQAKEIDTVVKQINDELKITE